MSNHHVRPGVNAVTCDVCVQDAKVRRLQLKIPGVVFIPVTMADWAKVASGIVLQFAGRCTKGHSVSMSLEK